MVRKLIKLPNLGNTCYINTALQVLLINDSLKKKLIISESKLSGFYKILLMLFKDFPNKIECIKALMREFNLKNEQGDSHEVLLKFIELLEKNEMKEEYTFIYYTKLENCHKCKIRKEPELFNISSWISYSDFINVNLKKNNEESCYKCQSVLLKTTKILIYPKYLVFYPLEKSLQLEINIDNNIKYKLKMLNIFIGLDNIGHYYNIYKTKDKWIKIDDDHISDIPNISLFLRNKLIRITSIIYKRVK